MPSQVLTRQNADSTQLTELRTAALAQLADDIHALLAERDGLRRLVDEISSEKDDVDSGLEETTAALSASNAALADALGLLREWATREDEAALGSALRDETQAFLAKHGPSP